MKIMDSKKYGSSGRPISWAGRNQFSVPKWIKNPDPADIKSTLLDMYHDSEVDVKPLASGFNRVYEVEWPKRKAASKAIMRVMLPVEPHDKTESEIVTMQTVQRISSLYIPKVINSDSHPNNPIGYEWILLEYIEGTPLPFVAGMEEIDWILMSERSQNALIWHLTRFYRAMFEHRLTYIGNLWPGTTAESTKLGNLISPDFYWADHTSCVVDKGPFRNSHQWLSARLKIKSRVCQDATSTYPTFAHRTEHIIKRLRRLLEDLFDPYIVEDTILTNYDLSADNVIISEEDDEAVGVVD